METILELSLMTAFSASTLLLNQTQSHRDLGFGLQRASWSAVIMSDVSSSESFLLESEVVAHRSPLWAAHGLRQKRKLVSQTLLLGA